jgi:DNA topoisomerase-1
MEVSVHSSAPGEFGTLQDAALVAASAARLRYVDDRRPGIIRERTDKGFVNRDPAGATIVDSDELARIKTIAVPPAWTRVWICPDRNGHIQATGRDARGRKQYRYHARWRSVRDESKFEHMLVFGRSLPRIRRQVEIDLARTGLPREKVLAAVVRLMERTLARVGNPEYARQNESFGLTTLKNHHVRIRGGQIELDFRAKSGVRHRSIVSDRTFARILKRCRELPGSELFQYVDGEGTRHSVDSGDVNEYLRSVSECDITAKDFRTWAGTNLAVLALNELKEVKPTKAASLRVVKDVAEQLGNTPAVCRKCYIHPAVLESYLEGSLQLKRINVSNYQTAGIWAIERELIHFLESRPRAKRPQAALKAKLRASLKARRCDRAEGDRRASGG